MEIYYGISKRTSPITPQSIIANSINYNILSKENLRKSILFRGFFNLDKIRPEKEDTKETKKMKRNYFDSQIYNMCGKNIKGDKNKQIYGADDNQENYLMTKDQLVDTYNNSLS